jgi:hypothetical protein
MAFSSDQPLLSNQQSISLVVPETNNPEFVNIMSLYLKRMADSLNTKEGALYLLQELATFKQFYLTQQPANSSTSLITRNVYRRTYDLVNLNGGNIAGSAVITKPHGITGLTDTALIYASCVSTDPRFFTVVYPNIYLTNTNIVFTNPLGTALTKCTVVAEYLKN